MIWQTLRKSLIIWKSWKFSLKRLILVQELKIDITVSVLKMLIFVQNSKQMQSYQLFDVHLIVHTKLVKYHYKSKLIFIDGNQKTKNFKNILYNKKVFLSSFGTFIKWTDYHRIWLNIIYRLIEYILNAFVSIYMEVFFFLSCASI